MLCSVCREKLAESELGRKAHMARYHNVLLEAKKTPTYKPMDPKEKAAKIARMEARLASKIVLDDKGELKGYGEPLKPAEPVLPEWPTTNFGFDRSSGPDETVVFEPVQGLGEPQVEAPTVEKEVTVVEEAPVQAVKVENDGWPVLETGPILTQEDCNKRLDNLLEFSGAVLTKMKQVFNQ